MNDRTHLEKWLPIPEFEGRYEVSDQGRIRSQLTDKILTPHFRRYSVVDLRRDGRYFKRYVHHLVAIAFIGPRPTGMLVRHRDDDRRNNSAANLVYGTQSQNMFDAVANGVHPTGSKTHCKNGHPFTPENTYIGTYRDPTGVIRPRRQCRACTNAAQRAYQERKRAS